MSEMQNVECLDFVLDERKKNKESKDVITNWVILLSVNVHIYLFILFSYFKNLFINVISCANTMYK